jgi:predicted nucleotidyltransferase
VTDSDIRQAISREAERIAALVPGIRWYLFGSFARNAVVYADIDLLATCPSHEKARLVRAEMTELCKRLPIHLLLMTFEEDRQLGFTHTQACEEFCCATNPDHKRLQQARPNISLQRP